MHAFAGLIVANPLSAILVIIGSVLFGLIAPPLTSLIIYIGGGALALYTLSNGGRDGALVLAGAALALGGLSAMVVGHFLPGLVMLVYWLPVWLAAVILRDTRSLAWSVMALTVLATLVVVLMFIAMGDPTAWWTQQLQPLAKMLDENPELARQAQLKIWIEQLPGMMTGLLAAGMIFACLISLLIGRWWQSLLVNPGGLRQEFYEFRLAKSMSLAGVLFFAVASVKMGWVSELFLQLSLVMMMPFLLSGLAMLHAISAARKLHRGWLIVLYILMGVFPQVLMLVVVLGAMDPWVDFRSRTQKI
ncbi:MAG: hypothetical protein V3V50_01300 [Gammaproteobacteria bacterium]